jgi:hypothetical protein
VYTLGVRHTIGCCVVPGKARSGHCVALAFAASWTVVEPACCCAFLLSCQGGLGGQAADAASGASLTCKDSLLVGWAVPRMRKGLTSAVLSWMDSALALLCVRKGARYGCTLRAITASRQPWCELLTLHHSQRLAVC